MAREFYFKANVEIFGKKSIATVINNAVVSNQGIFRIYEESKLVRAHFHDAKILNVKIDDLELKGRLVREQGDDGVHYNLRLVNFSQAIENKFFCKMKAKGYESPWQRQYPRIQTTSLQNDFEFPAIVSFPRVVGFADGETVNFSYHGMLFEFFGRGISLGEYVGKRVNFCLVSNYGTLIGEVDARIMRIYDEMYLPGKMIRGLGVKFIAADSNCENFYKRLIINICNSLKDKEGLASRNDFVRSLE